VIIISKTFTTAETILNAKTVRESVVEYYSKLYPDEQDKMKFV
jgi:glucose-6-phosphate isomerase